MGMGMGKARLTGWILARLLPDERLRDIYPLERLPQKTLYALEEILGEAR